MKSKFTLTLLIVLTFLIKYGQSQAYQIPNGGFEIWDSIGGAPLNPHGWATYESIFGFQLGLASPDTGYFGTLSVKLRSDSVTGAPGIVAGVVSLGTGKTVGQNPTFSGMPFAYRPDTIFFAFKYSTPGIDTPVFDIEMSKQSSSLVLGVTGILQYTAPNTWDLAYFDLTTEYLNNNTPDTLLIQFFSSYNNPVVNSTLHVDGVYFGYVTLPLAIQQIVDKLDLSIYPNPATDVIYVTAANDLTGYKVLITDMNGRLVSMNTLTGSKSSVDLHTLASGTYLYRIADREGNIFRQDKFIVAR